MTRFARQEPFMPPVPPRQTAWQDLLDTLHMKEQDALRSPIARDWVRKNHRRYYLPENVLKHFNLSEDL